MPGSGWRTTLRRMPLRRRIPLRAGALVALLCLLGPAPAPGADDANGELVDGIAAQVGTGIVLISEVMHYAAPMEQQLRAQGAPQEQIDKLRADVLERMIERRLIEQAIKRTELEAPDAEVDAAIEAIAADNGLSMEELRASVAAQGLEFDAYRERIRGEIERQMLINGAVSSQVRVEESEVRALYARRYADQPSGGIEVHLRHILIPFNDDKPITRQIACDRARTAHQRLVDGAAFPTVASQVSVVAPQEGGDIGWLHQSEAAPWMIEAVAPLQPGQFSNVIELPFGCNILQLVDRREYERIEYEEVQAQLSKVIYDQKMAEKYSDFLEQLRATTYIERKGIFADAGTALTSSPSPGNAATP